MEIKVKLSIPVLLDGQTLYFRALEGSGHQQMPIFIRMSAVNRKLYKYHDVASRRVHHLMVQFLTRSMVPSLSRP
jgi:hypothetical protein